MSYAQQNHQQHAPIRAQISVLSRRGCRGLGLVELLVVAVIASLIFLALSGVIGGSLRAREYAREHNELTQQANFAMQRMVRAVSRTDRLVLPLGENPATAWSESIRDPGVLAVALDHKIDRDSDGFADADNDKDGLVDEDMGADNNFDGEAGIAGIDDDNDGEIDESGSDDDDEDEDDAGDHDEDPLNGKDDDNDGSIDEDFGKDHNNDGESGIAGKDDDGDGDIDETGSDDDDEDEDTGGEHDEDWLDTVVYYLAGSKLMERMPNINPVDGTDYTENVIANFVTQFRVERLVLGAKKNDVVDITISMQDSLGDLITLNTRIRPGAGR